MSLTVDKISDGTTEVDAGYVVNGSAKAFSNFDSTGTLTARKSLNVSSFIDDGVGAHRVNFTSDMNDADYGELGCTAGSGASNGDHSFVPFKTNTGGTTSQSKQLSPSRYDATRTDSLHLMYFVFGDLAV
jgi:hypothetical protein